ncbi:hypothetical protein D3C81_788170 [compost metagenome]
MWTPETLFEPKVPFMPRFESYKGSAVRMHRKYRHFRANSGFYVRLQHEILVTVCHIRKKMQKCSYFQRIELIWGKKMQKCSNSTPL